MKNELKYYDQAFIHRFQRPPNRTEKEPMRQIYMYYKRLKQFINKAATINGGNSKRQDQALLAVKNNPRSYSAGPQVNGATTSDVVSQVS